jgi:hypothetical protein
MHKQKKMLNKVSNCFFSILFICIMNSCNNKSEKGDYKRTIPICNDLYIEVYRTFGSGAFGSDLVDDYLTDSTNFRLRIGSYDEYYGSIYYHCEKESITIEKREKSDTNVMHTTEIKIYNLRKLKALQNISKLEIETISDKYLFTNK